MPASALLTDLYQLTMLQGYFAHSMHETAVFEFFVRSLKSGRNFLIAAGLEQASQYLESIEFQDEELQWLATTGFFRDEFLDWLRDFRFTGDIDALPEGTVCFADEPVIQVTAPLPEAQLVESRLINLLQFQTMIASKAARCVLAADGKPLVDFGFRRAHGEEAGVLAARAAYLAGFTATATVQAGFEFRIPVVGTMAHAFVLAHDDETTAFEQFALANPDNVVLLIDTWDTEAGAAKVVELAPRLQERGIPVKGVRLDSGDLAEHAKNVRGILDDGGLPDVTIFASGNLDEDGIAALQSVDAPIDGFGVGTRLDVSADAPYLECAYKLVEYAGTPRRKGSEGKATLPGRKQIWREFDSGRMTGDQIGLREESLSGTPLLEPVIRNGERVSERDALDTIRSRVRSQLDALPDELRGLTSATPFRVALSERLREMASS